jgi:GNAT superfamily N-acetyltransferase
VPRAFDERVEIRLARPREYAVVDDMIVRAYDAGGLVPAGDPYARELATAALRAAEAELYVAAIPDRLIGSVTYAPGGSPYAVGAGPDEAVFRLLVVEPVARHAGIGADLVLFCADRARTTGARTLCLSTFPAMTAAHRLYERLGFVRTPDRDRISRSGALVLTYALPLR